MSVIKKIETYAESYKLSNCLKHFNSFIDSNKKENSGSLASFFLEIFDSLSKDFLVELTEASNYYFFSVLATDKLVDEENFFDPEFLLMAIALREDSLHKMYNLIEPSNLYWSHFKKYYHQYVLSVSNELNNHRKKITPIETNQMEQWYSGNSALAKALPIAMAYKSDNIKYLIQIENSIDHFYIGMNLFDDVNDWKLDWENGNFSFLITQTIINSELDIASLTSENLGKYIFFNGEAINCLELSIYHYEKALKEFDYINCQGWKSNIKLNLNKCINLRDDIKKLISRQIKRVNHDNEYLFKKNVSERKIGIKKQIETLSTQGIKYIINQLENNNSDTTINSYFPNADGFIFSKRYYEGDVFQRAIIVECLYDLSNKHMDVLSDFFNKELSYLNNMERHSGGWNFYKDLEFQPNDLDTTAQVIHILDKSNRINSISHETLDVIEMMLKQQNKKSGRIGTWILPEANSMNKSQEKQHRFIKNYAGHDLDSSVDIDVMANFLLALSEIDYEKYKYEIALGIEFIENNQNEDGSWSSTWYWGNYYGTYLCLKLFSKVNPRSKTINKAIDFILLTQNTGGGWGYKNSISDPLNTSYSLIALSYCDKFLKEIPIDTVNSAIGYLLSALNEKQEMNKCDFINLRKKKYSSYKSNSVTLAVGLKALSIWQNVVSD